MGVASTINVLILAALNVDVNAIALSATRQAFADEGPATENIIILPPTN